MTSITYIRKIIERESALGFLFIPSKGQGFLPAENTKIVVHLHGKDKETKSLSYNADYNRIFGLTRWYQDNQIVEGTYLDIKIENKELYVATQITRKKTSKPLSNEEDEESSIDISNLSSGAKGNIVEDRIKEMILLYGQGMLNVYKPVIDNEGIDLIALKNGQFHSIFLQVKSRYTAYRDKKLILTLGKNFKAHNSYFLVAASFNPLKMEVEDRILFIPSKVVLERASKLSDGNYRIVASLVDKSNDQWQEFIISKEAFVSKLFDKFLLLEEHYS